MRIFVASWFFPPATSSEGIVSYKLFRNSKHTYDVCSAKVDRWGYGTRIEVDADNIEVVAVDADSPESWVPIAVQTFEERHAKQPYDAIMTRSMPPESVLVGQEIRRRHPEIPWIASLADPIAKEPYDIKGRILENDELTDAEKDDFPKALSWGCEGWKTHRSADVREMCRLKDIEDIAIKESTVLITPCDTLKSYILGSRRRLRVLTVPHSFDRALYPVGAESPADAALRGADADPAGIEAHADKPVEVAFLGHSDPVRSLEPVVRAAHHLRQTNPRAADRLKIRFIGHAPEKIRTLVMNFYLQDMISIEPSVDYLTSLRVMEDVDWLLHIDARFDFLSDTGGSVYFAGKIADYMGTDDPILALTGAGSPAAEIVSRAGGFVVDQTDIVGIADALANIAEGRTGVHVDRVYRDSYDARVVAARYDEELEAALAPAGPFDRPVWPEVENFDPDAEKLLSICVPSYNVEVYLDRCLYSMVTAPCASNLEVLVVNDGSPDSSRDIGLAYQNHYPTIVKLIDKENGGHGSTINAALAVARGRYFRVVDGDDWIDGENLAKTLSVMEERGLWADLVSSNYHQVNCSTGEMIRWMKVDPRPYYELFDLATTNVTMEYFTIHSMMVKTDVLRAADFKIQENTFYVDVEYGLFPIPYVQTVMFTPEYIYRYNIGNAEQSINFDVFLRRYDHHDRVMRRMVAYLEEKRAQLTWGQLAYMEVLFKEHLLETHFSLSLLWDYDKARGFARAKDFWEYLERTSPALAAATLEIYPGVKRAHDAGFDPARTGQLTELRPHGDLGDTEAKGIVHGGLRKVARALASTNAGRKIAYNPVTEKISRKLFYRE